MAVYALADKPGVAGVAYVDIDAMASRAEILRMVDRVAKGDGRLPSPLTGTSGRVVRVSLGSSPKHARGAVVRWVPGGRRRSSLFRRKAPGALDGTLFAGHIITHHDGPEPNFWQSSSNRFYVKAHDETVALLLGKWMASRCGFKDQLPLWHALLSVADRVGDGACLRSRYRGTVFSDLSYWKAHNYPARSPRSERPDPSRDALLWSCKDLLKACPDLRICADKNTHVFEGLHHSTVEALATRNFTYADRINVTRVIQVPDNPHPAIEGTPAGPLPSNAHFIEYFGLDLTTDDARQAADRDWSWAAFKATFRHRARRRPTAQAPGGS